MTTVATSGPDVGRPASLAGVLTIGLAVGITVVAAQQRDSFEAPAIVPRSLLVLALLSAPGVIALLGGILRRRELVVSAGVLCLAQSPIAFSLVTFVFLIPGLILLRYGLGAHRDAPIRPARLALAVVIGVPIVWVLINTLGFLAPILLVALGALLPALRPAGRPRPAVDAIRALVGIVVVALVIGAWVAGLAMTETVCWTAHADAGGIVRVERIPTSDSLSVDSGDVASGCDGGVPTTTGVAATGGLLAAAFLLCAMQFPKPRRTALTPG